jgi:hypothetical protein
VQIQGLRPSFRRGREGGKRGRAGLARPATYRLPTIADVPSVLFIFGDTSRTITEGTVLEIVTRLEERTIETDESDFHQLALKIRAPAEGTTSSDLVVTENDIDMLWSVVDELRKEKPEDESLEFLWQGLHSDLREIGPDK